MTKPSSKVRGCSYVNCLIGVYGVLPMTLRHAVVTALLLVLSGSQALSSECTGQPDRCSIAASLGNGRDWSGYECIRGCPGPTDVLHWGYIMSYEDRYHVTCLPDTWDWNRGGRIPKMKGAVTLRGFKGWVIEGCLPGLIGYIKYDFRTEHFRTITWVPVGQKHSRPTDHMWLQRPGGMRRSPYGP
jgi:hypothetical protein